MAQNGLGLRMVFTVHCSELGSRSRQCQLGLAHTGALARPGPPCPAHKQLPDTTGLWTQNTRGLRSLLDVITEEIQRNNLVKRISDNYGGHGLSDPQCCHSPLVTRRGLVTGDVGLPPCRDMDTGARPDDTGDMSPAQARHHRPSTDPQTAI